MKTSCMTSIQSNLKNSDLILTIITIISVFSINMSFKTNIKLIFLLLASLICIYDLKYLFPFIITFLILKIHNLKKSKKKKK